MPSKAKLWSSKSHCYKLWISENLEKQFRTTSYKCNDAYFLYPEYSSENSPCLHQEICTRMFGVGLTRWPKRYQHLPLSLKS